MKRGPIMVFVCFILWGLLPLYWKIFQSVDSYYLLSNRIVWSFLCVIATVLIMRRRHLYESALKDKRKRRLLLWAGIFCVLNWGSYIIAINTNHIIDASLAYFLTPIMSIVFGAVVFRERLAPLQWAAVVLAIIGVLISVISYGHVPWMALFIAITFTIYGALQKLSDIDGVSALGLELRYFFIPVLILIGWLTIQGRVGEVSPWQWWMLPTTGIITALPLVLYGIGLRETDYSLTGILMYVNPTLQLFIGVVVYKEPFTAAQVITFAFVWLAIVLYISSILYKKRHMSMLKNS